MDNFDDIVADMGELQDKVVVHNSGKNKKSDVYEYGYHFDSKEELDFYEWVVEAKELGFIESFEYQPSSFVLFNGVKNAKGKYIERPHEYTADYRLHMTDKWVEFRKNNKLKIFDKFDERDILIDVKGAWSIYDDGRSFKINQKWLLDKYNLYVWKIVPLKFFEKVWLPEKCILTRKTKKVSLKYKDVLTFKNHRFKV